MNLSTHSTAEAANAAATDCLAAWLASPATRNVMVAAGNTPKGVTAGLQTILAARHVLIMACGSHKTAAVKAMVEGPRGAPCPASFLQGHADVRVFLDDAAAAKLSVKS